MVKKIELLAPGGDVDSIKAAIIAGADAIYCGLDKFNARNRADNINLENLQGILSLAHKHNCEVFLTLNILVLDNEFPALIALLNKLLNTSIDGVIVQDLGLFYLLKKYFKSLKVHASTQTTTHNSGQILFLKHLNVERVNLSRELNIQEIKSLTNVAHESGVLTEVFVHGSYCISFSGLCYISSVHSGNSGNRGRCSQPCRDQYITTANRKDFPLNLKDNSAFLNINELANAGVDSLKIEGRIKKFHYVYTVVDAWRKQLLKLYSKSKLSTDNKELYKVFNRDFTNGFLRGDMGKNMFIDNARDNSAVYLAKSNGGATSENIEKAKQKIFDERTGIINNVRKKLDQINIDKSPLHISVSGRFDQPLMVKVKTPEYEFQVYSNINLASKGTEALSYNVILKRFKSFDETELYIENIELNELEPNVYLPFKELTAIKKQVLFHLNNSKEWIDPIEVPVIPRSQIQNINPSLSVLISSEDDLYLCNKTSAQVYFLLPNNLHQQLDKYIDLFRNNRNIKPWFPAILIGQNYNAAVSFLDQLKPKSIVSNNSGVAFEAYNRRIAWIAGPQLNLVNSHSLVALKNEFNCSGAFVSNELNKTQLKHIKEHDDFELHFSIYHPIELMTSRQCLFQQVTGCEKSKVDDACLDNCKKSALITSLKENASYIDKTKGNYNKLYNHNNYLNTDIIKDIPNKFSGFLVDLSIVKTETEISIDKFALIKLFESFINGKTDSDKELNAVILNTTTIQYQSKKGI